MPVSIILFASLFIACGENKEVQQTTPEEPTSEEQDPVEEQTQTATDTQTEPEETGLPIHLGIGIGDIQIGMSYAELKTLHGEVENTSVWNRMATGQYPEQGIEVAFSSAEDFSLSEDAIVIAVSALLTGEFSGDIQPLMYQSDIEALYGPPELTVANRIYYPQGFAAELDPEGKILKLALFPAYEPNPEPPMMEYSASEPVTEYTLPTPQPTDSENYEIVDIHLHTGAVGNQSITGRGFIISMLPNNSKLYYLGTNPVTSQPFAPHTGLRSQTEMAGIRHGVLLATYAHHTVSYTTNKQIEALLSDPRNISDDGSPWSWGMASINLDDLDKDEQFADRLAAMESYLENRPDIFIGIKLAHAHQQVAFDDERHHAIFDVAGKHQAPILMHTGFSPFPGTSDDPDFYDPISLEISIQEYDGNHGKPKVDFILSHVGQGDQRATDNALYLASTYDNVWLEISALGGGVLINAHGEDIVSEDAQYIHVLQQIKAMGLEHRTIFASDGPQYSGKIRSYLNEILDEMHRQEYTEENIRKILAGNFYQCFFGIE